MLQELCKIQIPKLKKSFDFEEHLHSACHSIYFWKETMIYPPVNFVFRW